MIEAQSGNPDDHVYNRTYCVLPSFRLSSGSNCRTPAYDAGEGSLPLSSFSSRPPWNIRADYSRQTGCWDVAPYNYV